MSTIRGVGFADLADTFFPLFTEGNIYSVSNASIQHAHDSYGAVRNNYQLMFTNTTSVSSPIGTFFVFCFCFLKMAIL